MSEYRLNALFWSLGLITGGVLILLFNLDILSEERLLFRYIAAGILAGGALFFFLAFLITRQHWWRVIPAWTLFALAIMVYLGTLGAVAATVTAALLFVGLAVSFAHIYLLDRARHWWALIPSGFLLVLGVVIALGEILPLTVLGALLFTGMGMVFGLLYVLGDRRQHWWALIPGAILFVFGLVVLAEGDGQGNPAVRWWPLLLIAAGLWIGWQGTRRHPPEKLAVHTTTAVLRKTAPGVLHTEPLQAERSALGDYSTPAPGASVEVLSEQDE